MKFLRYFYVTFIYTLLYMPIVYLVIYSFNSSKYSYIWTGFSTKYYDKLFKNANIIEALNNSIILAVVSSLCAIVVALSAAYSMYRYKFIYKQELKNIIYALIIYPDITIGISLLIFFSSADIELGATTLILAHTFILLPYAFVNIMIRLKDTNPNIIYVAKDLGANEVQIFTKVILPILLPSMVVSFLLGISISFDDVIVSFLVSGNDFLILPIKIFSMARLGVGTEINVLCSLIILFTFITVLLAIIINKIISKGVKKSIF